MCDAVFFLHFHLCLEEMLLACMWSVPPNHRKVVGADLKLCFSVWLIIQFCSPAGFESQSQGCSTDMDKNCGTPGHSVGTLGQEPAQDITVSLEKTNEKIRLLA